jgi:hypothetical protein
MNKRIKLSATKEFVVYPTANYAYWILGGSRHPRATGDRHHGCCLVALVQAARSSMLLSEVNELRRRAQSSEGRGRKIKGRCGADALLISLCDYSCV